MAEHRRAWDRRPGEHARAFHALGIYLALGPTRTLPQVAEADNLRVQTVRDWSSTYDWRLRAAAHDEHYEAIYWRAADDEAAEMGRRHVQVAQAALGAVQTELAHLRRVQATREAMLAQLPRDPLQDDKAQRSLRRRAEAKLLSGRDMAVLIKAAADLEHRVTVVEGAKLGGALDDELATMGPDELREELARLTGVPASELQERGL
jgi:hypothetical protein